MEATKLLNVAVGNVDQVSDYSMEETTLARAYVSNDAYEVSSLDFNVNVSQLNELT